MSGLIVILVGLVIYLSIARQLDEPEEPKPTATSLEHCPKCPPQTRPPLFVKLFKPVDFRVDFYGMSYEGNSANLIDQHVLFFGAYEKDVLNALRDVTGGLAEDERIFIDVGANTGLHSLFMSKHATRVHAFEPYEPVLARLRSAIARNAIENITVHPVGLGDAQATVPFHKPPDKNLGSGSFVAEFQPGNEPKGELQIAVGDDALAKAGVDKVGLIKMDIEGYEKLALRGLRKTLKASRPVVAVEVTMSPRHTETFKSGAELRAAFPADYAFLRFVQTIRTAATGEYKLEPFDFDFSHVGQRMLLAYPKERKLDLEVISDQGPAQE